MEQFCQLRLAISYAEYARDQYRICFVWKDGEAQQVEVVDYH